MSLWNGRSHSRNFCPAKVSSIQITLDANVSIFPDADDYQMLTATLSSFLFPDGLCLFRAFLVSEFSEENIAFYLACEDFKATKSSKLTTKAKKIFDEFIGSDAPREVIVK